MAQDWTVAETAEMPDCDFCAESGKKRTAQYDGRTKFGPWAYMCDTHFRAHGIGLGLGKGQRLILADA